MASVGLHHLNVACSYAPIMQKLAPPVRDDDSSGGDKTVLRQTPSHEWPLLSVAISPSSLPCCKQGVFDGGGLCVLDLPANRIMTAQMQKILRSLLAYRLWLYTKRTIYHDWLRKHDMELACNLKIRAAEMVQWLGEFAALPGDQSDFQHPF